MNNFGDKRNVFSTSRRFVVIKFGGTSVATRRRWNTIREIIHQRMENHYFPVVVCSAKAGITNILEGISTKVTTQPVDKELAHLKQSYLELAADLEVDFEALLATEFTTLLQYCQGCLLLGELSPRIRAKILAFGEACMVKLGCAFLCAQGTHAKVYDSRDWLQVEETHHSHMAQAYLAANLPQKDLRGLREALCSETAEIALMPGFIGRNSHGDTVLFGRGGSDSSATCIAALLKAEHCEIWTDVPGMFTANPSLVPEARLLKFLAYEEAQEMASTGAKVLHPRAIEPLRKPGIPLQIFSTLHPHVPGTNIGDFRAKTQEGVIKSLSVRTGITLLSIESLKMWQEVGFLADLFMCFKKHGFSIDLLSTSESNVTVSLDTMTATCAQNLPDLLTELKAFGTVKQIFPCGVISLVGRYIRSILHKICDILQLFADVPVYLLSQAASDLNLSFVIPEENTGTLLRELHKLLFENITDDTLFGLTWKEISSEPLTGERSSK